MPYKITKKTQFDSVQDFQPLLNNHEASQLKGSKN